MKKIHALLALLFYAYACAGQTDITVVKITYSESGINCLGEVQVKADSLIGFDLSLFKGCDTTGLKITLGKTFIDWSASKTEKTLVMPNDGNAVLRIQCADKSGTCKIKLIPPSTVKKTPVIQCGNTLQDAIQLSDWWKKKDPESIINARRLLKECYKLTQDDFKKIIYLSAYEDLSPAAKGLSTGDKNTPLPEFAETSSAAPVNASGIFSPTLVIDALGKFAAKRFKEELTIAFLQKFRDTLMSETYIELRLLLPRTFHTLATADVFNYAQFYQSLHENAQTDLYNLPENTAAMLRYRQNDDKDTANHIPAQLYEPIMAGLDLVRILELKMSASTAVEFLASRDYIDAAQATFYGNTARTLGVFSKHLHSWEDSTATGWADERYLARIVTDQDAFNFWMALVLKQEENSLKAILLHMRAPKAPENMYDLLNSDVLSGKQTYLRETFTRFSEVQAVAKNLVSLSKTDSLSKSEMFSKYTSATFGLLIAGVEFVKQADPSAISDKPGYDRAIQLLKAGQDLAVFAHRKRFGDGISVLLEIVKLLYAESSTTTYDSNARIGNLNKAIREAEKNLKLAKQAKKKADDTTNENLKKRAAEQVNLAENKLHAIKGSLTKKEYKKEQAAREKLEEFLSTQHAAKILHLIDKYGNLLVSCANAQNSDQLLAILEKTASPVQSYLKKRGAGRITAAINMYPGLALGYEYQLDEAGKFTNKGGTVLAFTTPVGLSLDFGVCKRSSFSVFASIIDIGAVTAFRLKDNASKLPELKWKNVLAPGAYLMWGIGGTPLTLGVGGQYGPALRNVQANTSLGLEEASHFRAGVTLTVDLPVFSVNVWAKKK